MIKDSEIEAMFEKWVKDEPNRNKVPESRFEHIAAQHSFTAAIKLLLPIIKKQGEVLETVSRNDMMGYFCGEEVRQAQREVEEMIKSRVKELNEKGRSKKFLS